MKVLRTLLAALGICLVTACTAADITGPEGERPSAAAPGMGSGDG